MDERKSKPLKSLAFLRSNPPLHHHALIKPRSALLSNAILDIIQRQPTKHIPTIIIPLDAEPHTLKIAPLFRESGTVHDIRVDWCRAKGRIQDFAVDDLAIGFVAPDVDLAFWLRDTRAAGVGEGVEFEGLLGFAICSFC
jgi:hypothetical protein